MIAAGQQDGSIGAGGAPEDLYDAIYGSLFYRYIFGIKPISPAYARNLVDTILNGQGLLTPPPAPRARRNQAQVSRVTAR